MKIAVIGAGHAGVEAARCAAESGIEVVLFSSESVWPYFRPRLVAVAFGQAEPDAIRMHPAAWYADRKIEVVLDQPITAGNLADGRLITKAGERIFDGLVLATGSLPIMPSLGRSAPGRVLPLWSMRHAEQIRRLIGPGHRVAVVGGGILGIETALRAVEAGMRATIVERLDRLMPMHFGSRASSVLLRRIAQKGIEVRLGRLVTQATEDKEAGRVDLALDDGDALPVELCVVAIGARPDLALARQCGLETERGARVNPHLQTSAPRVFAAGDLVMFQGVTRCSVREAVAQGRSAALNLVAHLNGQPMAAYHPTPMPLTFKARDFELYSAGELARQGCSELCLEGTTDDVYRALVVSEGRSVGVQLVGTGEGFDELLRGLGGPVGTR